MPWTSFWGPAHALPLVLPAMVKKLLSVHDVLWRAYPETMSAYNRLVHRLLVGKSIRQADMLLVPSESTKGDVAEYLGTNKAIMRAVYEGVDGCHHPPKCKQDHDRGLAALPGISSGSKALRIAPGRASHFLKLDIRGFAIEV